MTAVRTRSSRSTGARWTALLGASVLLHGLVLAALAFRMPVVSTSAVAPVMDVALVEVPPFVRPLVVEAVAPPLKIPVVVLDAPPRFTPPKARTGDTGNTVDLFGLVFADGQWPRPIVVRGEPCDPNENLARADRRHCEVLLIGLASARPPGSNPRP